MTTKKRLKMGCIAKGLICLTFLGAIIKISLVVASLITKHWIKATAKRTITKESEGRIQFGLFYGRKELNVRYGWRTDEFSVVDQLKHEPEILNYSLWLGTVACVCIALLFCIISAVFAIINSVKSTSAFLVSVRGLFLWNFLALLANLGVIGFWLSQFFFRIQYNVMTREDRDNMWTSENMAELGYSFWFVVGAVAMSLINILILFFASTDNDETDSIHPVLEENTNGGVMLY